MMVLRFEDLQSRAQLKNIRLTKACSTITPWGWKRPTYELYHPELGLVVVDTLKEVEKELEEFEKELEDK